MIDEKKLIYWIKCHCNPYVKPDLDLDTSIKIMEFIENQIEKVGDWIPCSERLPEDSGTYVVNAIENGIIHVSFAKWMPRMKTWNLTGSRAYWKVNAWMPLPEPYIYTESEDNKHD